MSQKPKPSSSLLRRIYGEICRGYTVTTFRDKVFYLKHLTDFEQTEADQYYQQHFDSVRKRGVSSREEKSKWLYDNDLWSSKKDLEIKRQEDYLKSLREGMTKMFLAVQIEQQKKAIEEEETRFLKMIQEREKLFGITAEAYADSKIQFYYIYLSFYKDSSLKKAAYSLRDIDEMDEDDSYELLGFYANFLADFSSQNLRHISISPFFQNSLFLCGENLAQFFGRPIIELTTFQNNLLSSGVYFKNRMMGETIPEEFRHDPDRIEEYLNKSAAAKEQMSKMGKEGNTGLVGAKKEDFNALQVKDDRSFMGKDTHLYKELNL